MSFTSSLNARPSLCGRDQQKGIDCRYKDHIDLDLRTFGVKKSTTMSAEIEFTDDEIREELARLGYQDVPEDKLGEFKKDLMKLITSERSRNTSLASSSSDECREDEPVHRPRTVQEISRPSHRTRFVSGNFSNHGSQWLDNNSYQEDWHYKGRKGSAPAHYSRPEGEVPGSYSLYEVQRGYRRDGNNCNEGEGEPEQDEVVGEYSRPSSPSETSKDGDEGKDDGVHIKEESSNVKENNGYAATNTKEESSRGDNSGAKSSSSESKQTTRKTFRISEYGCRRADGSLDKNDTAGIFEIYERIRNMAMRDCECGKTRPKSCDTKPPYRITGVNRCPSVIIGKAGHPHTRNLVRCRPGERLKMYNKLWKKQRPIGEDTRTELRKQVRKKMLEKEEIQMDRKVYVPNTYEVPTTKSRHNLRWQVRTALENYRLPPHGVFHDVI